MYRARTMISSTFTVTTASPTWRKGDLFASWLFELRPHASGALRAEPSERWLSASVQRVLRQMGPGAHLRRVAVRTAALGKDAFTADLSEPAALARLFEYLNTVPEFVQLTLSFAVPCVDLDGNPFLLEDAGELHVDVAEEVGGPLALGTERPLRLALHTRTSLFTEATFDSDGDNRAWARANRPILRGMLTRLATLPNARYLRCESEMFPDQVTSLGFSNLATEFRCRPDRSGDYGIESTLTGEPVLWIRNFGLQAGTPFVSYEASPQLLQPTARVLTLDHFVPIMAVLYGQSVVAEVVLENALSGCAARFAGATAP